MADPDPAVTEELRLHLLVLRCQAGDERAFGALVRQFGDRTRRYLRGLVGDAADDVQQDVWLNVYRNIRTLANPRAFRTWLFQTTRHRAIDHLRRRRRERELLIDVSAAAAVPAVSEDDAMALDAAELDAAELDDAMAVLAPVHREALVLRYRDGMSYAEIALVAGCSIGTVRSRLHNAKEKLQELMAKHR
ncbi:MAG TPA: sigma-70 family RNA polymerase sigma factor [Gemmatimonadaceae bacterium]|nr:sigma-70 family RNA polymerase sigma factor [Gemmatimonadaceae bacterium]